MSDLSNISANTGQAPGPLTFERILEIAHEFAQIYPIAYAFTYRIEATQEELYGPHATRTNVGRINGALIPATAADQAVSPNYRGQVDLAYSSFRDEADARQTLVHEILGHFGLNTLDRSEKRALLESIVLSRHQPGLDGIWLATSNVYADQPDLLIAEELYCSLVETNPAPILTASSRPAILDKLAQHGPQLLQPEDIKSIAAHVATGLHDRTRDQVIFPVDRRAQFSRTASDKADNVPGPLTLERTRQLLNDFCETYPVTGNIDFRIRATQEELYGPQATRERVGTIFGGYVPATRGDQERRPLYRGRCDLAYSSFRDETSLRRCLQHEIAGHFGLNTCRESEKRAILESIERSRNVPGIKEIWDQASYDYADLSDTKLAEEVFSFVAEDHFSGHPQLSEPPNILDQLRTHGSQLIGLDDLQDIAAHIATGLHDRTRDQVIFPVDRRAQFSRTASDKADKKPFHEVVANELISQIEAGTAPWQKPWNAEGGIGGMPLNPTTGKRYKSINAIHLLAQGHSDPRWLTYKQAVGLDAQVKKGERGTAIQYWKFEDSRIKTDESGKPVMGSDGTPVQERFKLQNPRVFYATVFNAEQIEGLAPLVVPELSWDPVERAEKILTNSGARIEHAASDRAYYSPSRDEIHLPLQAQFPSARNYYATALHELGHWTGHESRLKRDLSHPFRSEGYAREELRAEIASMMLSAELGLPHDPSQHAAYVASWVSVLKKDPLEIFRAAADAEKIHALAMSFAPELTNDLITDVGVATPTPSPAATPAPSLPLSPVAQDITPLAKPELAAVIDAASTSMPTSAPAATKVISMPLQPLSVDDVRDALSYISPNLPRDDWARIGMALKSEFPNDMGLDLFDQWSSTGEGYDRNSVISTWRSIRADGPVKIGTLLKQAQDNGFKPRQDSARREASAPRMDAATQAAQAAAAAVEQQERLTQQQNAATQAQQMWQDAQPGSEAAYLQRKNVQAHGTRTTANGTLLVPLVDDQGMLWNVQRILPTKLDNGTDKLFLKGGRKSGLFHVIGNVGSSPDQPILFAEGYATAASLHEATGWPTVVCLDAGNLIKVTNQFRTRHPGALMIVAGDDDTQTMATKGVNPGRQKAGLAAEQAQAVVAFPQGLTPEHSDFNDLVAQLGTQAGHAQIRASVEAALLEYVGTPQSPSTSLAAGGVPQEGQLTAQQVLAANALTDLKALGQPLPQAIAIEDTPEIRSTPISLTAGVNPGDAPSAPLQSESRFEVRRVGQVNEEQIAQFAQLSSAVYFAAGQDDAKTLQIHHNGTLLKAAQLNAYLDAMVLERTSPALAPGAQQLSQLHAAVLAVTLPETPRAEGTPPYAVIRTENDQAEKIGDFAQLSSAVYFAAGQDDAQTLQIRHNGASIDSAQLSAYIDAMVLERTSPSRSIGQARLEQLRLAALPKVPTAAAVDPFENAMPTKATIPAEVLEANKTSVSASQVPADPAVPLARADLNNDLNLEALQAKRIRDAQQVRQEMGNGMDNAPKPSIPIGTSDFESAPFLGMNSVSATAPTQDPSSDNYLSQDLRALRERLAKEYQFDGVSKYFYRQGKQDLAFEDKGSKFNTPHHAPEVAASIAQLAHAKGWREMYLTGTAEFCREMWLQASLLNMKVIGYEPEAIDQVRLTERKQLLAKDQASKPTDEVPASTKASDQIPNSDPRPTGTGSAGGPSSSHATSASSLPPVNSTPAPALLSAAAAKQLDSQLRNVLIQKGANDPQVMEMTLTKLYAQVQSPRVYLGKLLEHGPAPYKFDPKEQNSYFVKLQTQTGPQTVWGVDLPRALAEMLPNADSAIGQDILLAFQGVKKVQTLVPQKDASGQPAPEKWELVDRNTWFAQPVMQAYAQSQQELTQMPSVIPAPAPAPAHTSTSTPVAAAAPAPAPAKPVQAMQAATPPADRLRHALAQLGADPLQAEITLASVQSLFASPKFQVGQLLEHGQAPLQFTQGQPPSYYLKLSTEQGPVMLWSADFPRAINNNPVQLGQTIVAAYRGIELVQDGTRPATPRNDWLVAPLERLHDDAQQGVIQRMYNAQTMPPSPAPAATASQEQHALYILREAMRQAGIPQEFAQAAFKDAQQMLGTAQARLPASLGQPGQQLTPVRPAVQNAPVSPSHSVSKKVGPSL